MLYLRVIYKSIYRKYACIFSSGSQACITATLNIPISEEFQEI